ncbi:TrkH family potassium uptake protein [Aureibacter tunicatorum]|uniref:Trk system potassium uptake protein TrkH n=1 Tax=Aureibacter tunicatorum TaxID=866807 RepID=A0AAE4BRG3_9BACT|nr:potassium transporter TrkG [Aureibacter tunicatorum]MDR6237760.1 trk system potassium uptake protein TrkH [Aureibacter tunicatorum]BDD02795.1 potassium transporter [Aureibacter tunicatorum]
MRLNLPAIAHILGLLLIINSLFMGICIPFSLAHNDGSWRSLLMAASITLLVGGLTFFSTNRIQKRDIRKKDGYVIVSVGWIVMSLFATLPYMLEGSIPNITDAFFETVSGYTTTGASILNDIESVPIGILTWRSMTQWIGGMGIIVLTVAIVPLLGMGGIQLFSAESPGLSPDKLKPRIADTAKRLWGIYMGLTMIETLLLMLAGMTFTEAFNHSLTTMATGGFSTKQDSVAYYDSPMIQYIIIVFMFFAGTNFSITYMALHRQFKKVWENEEFRYYSLIILACTLIISIIVIFNNNASALEKDFRDVLFQVVSVITTTGFVTADYTQWTTFVMIIILILMFVGGSAGSTAGGVKVIRHVILFKNSLLEFRRQLHPHGVIPVRINRKAIESNTTFNVLAFIFIYLIVFSVGVLILAALGLDFETSVGALATSLGNIGPGIGKVGPMDNFAWLPDSVKWVLSFFMLLGRLELFTLLLIFTPSFWKEY